MFGDEVLRLGEALRSVTASAVAAERERCAKIAKAVGRDEPGGYENAMADGIEHAAELIEAKIRSGE